MKIRVVVAPTSNLLQKIALWVTKKPCNFKLPTQLRYMTLRCEKSEFLDPYGIEKHTCSDRKAWWCEVDIAIQDFKFG